MKTMAPVKDIGLVAHDHLKKDMAEWVEFNYHTLVAHRLICTGTTGKIVEEVLQRKIKEDRIHANIHITRLNSGPLGGDQQLGSLIVDGKVDILIFFWDPMQPQPHDVDVKALERLAVLYNVPLACNRSTADFIISSSLFGKDYEPKQKDYSGYINRPLI